MNRNALLLKIRATKGKISMIPKSIMETPKNISNDKFNPDVKSKFLQENGNRKKNINPSEFNLPNVIIKEKSKVNVDLDKIELARKNLPPVSKAKRKIQTISEKVIETQSKQKEITNAYYIQQKIKIEKDKNDVDDILNQY